jgi:hypothetical protein
MIPLPFTENKFPFSKRAHSKKVGHSLMIIENDLFRQIQEQRRAKAQR